jgi:hypothetical protein
MIYGDLVKDDEMGRACSRNCRRREKLHELD